MNAPSPADLPGFQGQLIGPDDGGYDEARAVYNAMIDRRPALIALCADADDVAKVVSFAAGNDVLLAVRGGGHNGAGLGTCDGGVAIDLSALSSVEVDPAARTVRVGGGCTWGEVDAATAEHGMATPSGIISTTGVGGLTLGGGMGHLTRKCGLTIDNLLEARRRRQLRRRHLLPLPAARGRRGRRRADLLAGRGRGRGAGRLQGVPARRAARPERLLRLHLGAARPALPRGAAPAQGVRRRLVSPGKRGGGGA
jgi:hypothetical protein